MDIYVREVVSRHDVLVTVVFDRDVCFTSRLSKRFHDDLGTPLYFSTTYHPQTDEQGEMTIQTLKDMSRVCVFDFDRSWNSYLSLAKFSYNDNFHYSIGMPPFNMFHVIGQRVTRSTNVVLKTTKMIQQVRETTDCTDVTTVKNWSTIVNHKCDEHGRNDLMYNVLSFLNENTILYTPIYKKNRSKHPKTKNLGAQNCVLLCNHNKIFQKYMLT